MRKTVIWASVALVLTACGNKEKEYDATGTFEATETTVFAEQTGQLVSLSLEEGDSVGTGQEVGLIDTLQLQLKIEQLQATKTVYQSQKPDMQKQLAATRQQLAKAQLELKRYTELVQDGAAPRKLLDDAQSQVLVLQRQLDAQQSALSTQLSTLESQSATADVQISQLRDQLRKCHIVTPAAGTVLEKYVEQGEFVATGKPLFRLADTGNMYLRAYVTSAQLRSIKVGQAVKVTSDYGKGTKQQYDGTVSWISSQSEFTPKTILTDDERADLVYAVKIRVRNDGYIKMGMYGEVKW